MSIYKEEIIEHYKNPNNKGNLNNYSVKVHDENTSCGDELQIEIKFYNNKIEDVKFQGKGCAISLASADILLDHVKNKGINEIKKLNKEDILKMLNIELTQARLKCALLSLNTLKLGVKNYELNN